MSLKFTLLGTILTFSCITMLFIPFIIVTVQLLPALLLILLAILPFTIGAVFNYLSYCLGTVWDLIPVPKWVPRPKSSFILKSAATNKNPGQDKFLAA